MIKNIVSSVKDRGIIGTGKRFVSVYLNKILLKYPDLIWYPDDLMVEPSSICNLRCPLCSNKDMKRKKGSMTYEQFKYIVDKYPRKIKRMIIGNSGEPLVNKDVFKMVKYASSKGIKVSIPTNATLFDKFSVDEVLNSGLYGTNISFDGASKKTFEEYRVGSNFEKVLENVTKLCHEKRKRGLKYPIITLQFLVMKHNEHEVEAMRELSKKIKPDYLFFKSPALWTTLTDDNREELAEKWLPSDKRFWRYNKDLIIKDPVKLCPFVFDKIVILWNGDVCLCCLDFEGEFIFGNVFEQSFKEILWGKKMRRIRRSVVDGKLDFCKECDLVNKKTFGEIVEYKDL